MRIPITPAIAAVAAAALITAPVVVGLTSSSSPVAPTVVCQHTTGTAAPLTAGADRASNSSSGP